MRRPRSAPPRLQGHIRVLSTQDIKLGTGTYPFTDQILVRGAHHTRLQITILGDEAVTPPAGQGPIELPIDPGTGTFGAPIWTRWPALSVLARIGLSLARLARGPQSPHGRRRGDPVSSAQHDAAPGASMRMPALRITGTLSHSYFLQLQCVRSYRKTRGARDQP